MPIFPYYSFDLEAFFCGSIDGQKFGFVLALIYCTTKPLISRGRGFVPETLISGTGRILVRKTTILTVRTLCVIS